VSSPFPPFVDEDEIKMVPYEKAPRDLCGEGHRLSTLRVGGKAMRFERRFFSMYIHVRRAFGRSWFLAIGFAAAAAVAGCGGGSQPYTGYPTSPIATNPLIAEQNTNNDANPLSLTLLPAPTTPFPNAPLSGYFLQTGNPQLSGLQYFGGPVVGGAVVHNIYVNCPAGPATCWGTTAVTPAISPGKFIADLSTSTFIKVLDQYIPVAGSARYTNGAAYNATLTYTATPPPGAAFPNTVSAIDVERLAYSAAMQFGGGLGQIYMIYLPEHVNHCDVGLQCRLAGLPNTTRVAFCAYHDSFAVSSLGTILYAVIMYNGDNQQCTPSSKTEPGTYSPDGGATDNADAMAQHVEHELFETITDPIAGTGWRADFSGEDEIGDLCEQPTFFFGPETLTATTYTIQGVYSNEIQGCTPMMYP
jgi:hypothetical protein